MSRKSRKTIFHNEQEKNTVEEWRVGLYTRLSIEDNGIEGGESISNQLDLLMEFLPRIANVTEVYTYSDNGASGTNFNRMQWEQMMIDVRNRKINCIVVKDLSRFARNYIEAGNYLDKIFPFLGVRFVAINDCYDSSGILFQENELTISLKNIINDYYAKDISKKITTSLRTKIQNRECVASMAPYGYLLENHHYVVDSVASKVVQRIYQLFLQGNSGYAIAKMLNEENIPSPSKYLYEKGYLRFQKCQNTIWTSAAIMRILYNEAYTGKLVTNKTNGSKFSNEQVGRRSPEDWTVIPNAHEAIIDEESFYTIKKIKKDNSELLQNRLKHLVGNRGKNLFLGFLFCGVCGHPLRRTTVCRGEKEYHEYSCIYARRSDEFHTAIPTIGEKTLSNLLLRDIRAQIQLAIETDDFIEKIKTTMLCSEKYKTYYSIISNCNTELNMIRKRKIEIYELYNNGELSKEEYLSVKKKYAQQQEEKRELLHKNEEMKNRIDTVIHSEHWPKRMDEFLNIEAVSTELLDSLINRIDLFPDKRIQVTYQFSEDKKVLLHILNSSIAGKGCEFVR